MAVAVVFADASDNDALVAVEVGHCVEAVEHSRPTEEAGAAVTVVAAAAPWSTRLREFTILDDFLELFDRFLVFDVSGRLAGRFRTFFFPLGVVVPPHL